MARCSRVKDPAPHGSAWESSAAYICADGCRRALPQLPCLARNCAEQACPGRKHARTNPRNRDNGKSPSRDSNQMERLFRGSGGRFPVRVDTGSPHLLQPKCMVLLRPIQVYGSLGHGLECTLHAKGADIDMSEDDGDEEYGDDGAKNLGNLHSGYI